MTEPKYYLIGFEYNNHWKAATIYAGVTKNGDLKEADEIKDGKEFSEQDAEKMRIELQEKFSDLTWYLLRKNN